MGKSVWATGLSSIIAIAASASAYAIEPLREPAKYKYEQNIDRNQVAYLDVVIQPDGTTSVTTMWSNGKQWAGNNFYSVVKFMSKDGKIITYVTQQKGLDGSGGGRARRGSETNGIKLTADQLAAFDRIEWKAGAKNCGLVFNGIKSSGEITFVEQQCETPRELKGPYQPTIPFHMEKWAN